MSKLDSISIQIVFHGEDIVNVLEENWLVHDAIWKHAKQHINAKVSVHVSARLEDFGPLDWSMSVTSPTGRKTFAIYQRAPTSSVTFTQG